MPGRARSGGYCRCVGLFGRKHRNQARPAATTPPEPASSEVDAEPPSAKEEVPPAPDPVKELQRLENLRDRGELSADEFIIEKRKIQASQTFRRI